MLKPLPSERWNFTTAAHPLNRAGFGGPPAEIDGLAALDPAGAVSRLLDFESQVEAAPDPVWAKPDPDRAERVQALRSASPEERRKMRRENQVNWPGAGRPMHGVDGGRSWTGRFMVGARPKPCFLGCWVRPGEAPAELEAAFGLREGGHPGIWFRAPRASPGVWR